MTVIPTEMAARTGHARFIQIRCTVVLVGPYLMAGTRTRMNATAEAHGLTDLRTEACSDGKFSMRNHDELIEELTEVIIANACDRTTRHAIKVAEAIAEHFGPNSDSAYKLVDVTHPEHNLTQAQNGTYYCNDSIGMMCAGNWPNEAGWHRHLANRRGS